MTLECYDATVERSNDRFPLGYAQSAIRKEIPLHVHDDQGVTLA